MQNLQTKKKLSLKKQAVAKLKTGAAQNVADTTGQVPTHGTLDTSTHPTCWAIN